MAKKNNNSNSLNHYFIIGAIALLLIVFLSFILLPNRNPYYECQQFMDGQNIYDPVANKDRLKNYDYYRIYLHDDNTFTLEYRLEDSKDKRTESGTYQFKNNNEKLILTYDNPTQEMDAICTYVVVGDYLIRDEDVQFSIGDTIYYYTVQQKFKYK